MSEATVALELRCPVGPRQLLGKVIRETGEVPPVGEANLMELSCRDCTKNLRREDPEILRVVHRYNLLGELVENVVTRR